MTDDKKMHFKAVRMLSVTTIFWSLSFPLVKALGILQGDLLPARDSWFHASLTGAVRFGAAAAVLALLCGRSLARITASEIWQGCGLGFLAGAGILLQMDGLNHTSASTSAFLTQAFCVIVPLIVAVRDRALPGLRLIVAVLMVLAGVALLANFDFREARLGRGETETLLSAIFFAAQIVWLERPCFARNQVNHFSLVMFAVMAAMSLPILAGTWQGPSDVLVCYSHPGVLGLMGALILFCTVSAFVVMNRWQPFVPATEAAIIYGAEPVFASFLALFLPGWISRWTGIAYANERITFALAAGGSLVAGANLLLQWKWNRKGGSNPAGRAAEIPLA